MIRVQVQLPEEQLRRVKSLASRSKVSIAEILRRAVGGYVQLERMPDPAEKRRRAMAVAGQFRSGRRDVSRRHDDYLTEAFRT